MMHSYRYDKNNKLIHYHQQKSHYLRIINAKSSLQTEQKSQITLSKSIASYSQRKRLQDNQHLINNLQNIRNNKGLLQRVKSYKRRQLSHTQFHQKQKQRSITKLNKDLVNKINEVKPKIGSKLEWKKHYRLFKKNTRKLQKHKLTQQYDPTALLNSTQIFSSRSKRLSRKEEKGLKVAIRDYVMRTQISSRTQTDD